MTAYRENWGTAFTAGVLGAGLMVAVLYLFEPIEKTRMDIALLLGSFFTRQTGPLTWMLGFGIHLLVGGVLGIVYGFVFEVLGKADWWRGALLSIFHTMLAGVAVWGLGTIHPLIPTIFPEPGYMGLDVNGALAFHMLVLNALFGATIGAMYHVRPEHRGYVGLHKPKVAIAHS